MHRFAFLFFLVLLLFCNTNSAFASKKPIPISFQKTSKLVQYLQHYKQLKFTDSQKANAYLKKLYGLSKRTHSERGLAYYYLSASEEATSASNFNDGVRYGKLAQQHFLQLKDSFNYMESTYFLAAAYLYLGDADALEKTVTNAFKHIPFNYSYEQNGMIYSLLANYYSVVDLSKAFNYIIKMKVNYQKSNSDIGLIDTYNELSNYYNIVFEYKKAFYYGKKALEMVVKVNPENYYALSNVQLNLAEIKINLKDYRTALLFAESGLDYAQKSQSDLYINRAHLVKSTCYFQQARYALSKKEAYQALNYTIDNPRLKFEAYLRIALSASQEQNWKLVEQYVRTCFQISETGIIIDNKTKASLYELLETSYVKNGNFRLAYEAQQKKNYFTQLFLNQKNSKFLQSLQVKYEFKKIQHQLKYVRTKARLKNLKINNQRTNNLLLLFIIVTLTFLSVLLFFAYKRSMRQKQAIEQTRLALEQSLADKNTLMKEIHHRVKNNFQLITSFLNPKLLADSDNIQEFTDRTTARIETMAKVHNQLYENEAIEAIPFFTYCQTLSKDVLHTFEDKNKPIRLTILPTEIIFNLQTILPLGLLLNELLMNTLKHAFKEQDSGEISIDLSEKGGEYTLIFKDNGSGFTPATNSSFGLKLVDALAHQLSGDLTIETKKGTVYTLNFKQLN